MQRSLIIFLFLICATIGHESRVLAASDLQNLLDVPVLTVGTVELDKDDIKAFYEARNYAPTWNLAAPDHQTAFDAFLDSIERVVDYNGLSHEDYALDLLRQMGSATDDHERLQLELLITDTLLQLAHDLHGDYGELEDLYVGWNFHRSNADIPALLAAAVSAHSLNELILQLTPKNPAYAALATALQTYKDIAGRGGWPRIEAGPTLRPHDKSPRVVTLRKRMIAENDLSKPIFSVGQEAFFDDHLRRAVMTWQQSHGLDADGNIGAATLAALNIPVEERINQIRANMERWRHMPDDFPPDHYVVINIAAAMISIAGDGKVIYRGPVVVGRVDRKTPFIQSSIRSMIINPIWHVPAKIAKQDILPKLRKDPHYLEKLGFVISGKAGDPYGENIDWESMPEREFNFRLRQSPGDMNSLGQLKFDFDNDFAVYMHGTPHQELFKKDQRNFSSGCIRLRDPEQVAEILLTGNDGHWDVKKIEEAIATGKTHWIGIAKPMPLYVLYWTVFTDESGTLNFRKDAYNYDGMLMPPSPTPETGKP